MAKNIEQFLKCLLVICNSSIENSLFRTVPYFMGLFGHLISSFLSSLYILEVSSLSDVEIHSEALG